ncbi:MAG: hypothetical protein ACQEXQ_06840 [Bacillota bacterium]
MAPNGWQLLVDYLEGGAKPDANLAERILWEYLDNLSIERCLYRPEVDNALFRRPPVRIPAIFYGYKGAGTSFSIGKPSEKNIGFRINDGVDIRFVESDREKPNFQHMKGEEWQPDELMYIQLAPNDWVAYEFMAPSMSSTSDYTLDMRLRMEDYGSITVCLNGILLGTSVMKGNDWQTVRLPGKFQAKEGNNRLVLTVEGLSAAIQWLCIAPV